MVGEASGFNWSRSLFYGTMQPGVHRGPSEPHDLEPLGPDVPTKVRVTLQ